MAKTNASFRLSGAFKRMIALTPGSQEQRNGWKRMFIDAQHSAEIAKVMSKKNSKGKNTD